MREFPFKAVLICLSCVAAGYIFAASTPDAQGQPTPTPVALMPSSQASAFGQFEGQLIGFAYPGGGDAGVIAWTTRRESDGKIQLNIVRVKASGNHIEDCPINLVAPDNPNVLLPSTACPTQ
jgi:hypothetical protein